MAKLMLLAVSEDEEQILIDILRNVSRHTCRASWTVYWHYAALAF